MLTVAGLRKDYRRSGGLGKGERLAAVRDVSLTAGEGDFFTLLGPSGCGKTTTLRCIAGLEQPDEGVITIGGDVVYSDAAGVNVQPEGRHLGMVFQGYAIWPHLTVMENVAFPLQALPSGRRPRRSEIRERVLAALDLVQLQGLADRATTELSGGQQQRVALARAVVARPRVLLLDEPLSNLDANLRGRMRVELKRLQRELGVTTVYVTHDQTEAFAMSDTVVVMENGRVAQVGSPQEVYFRPESRFVASFVGSCNFLDGTVVSAQAPGHVSVKTRAGVVEGESKEALSEGESVTVMVRAEVLGLRPSAEGTDPPSDANVLAGRVARTSFLGEVVEYDVATDGQELRVRAPHGSVLAEGTDVRASFLPSDCLVIPERSGG